MDKYEYREKTEKMLEYAEKKQYQEAMEIAEQIEWRRVKSVLMLSSVSEIYERNGEYAKSRLLLGYAYKKQPGSRKLAYRLSNLALKDNDIEKASDYYEEFVKIAPKDPNQFILKYKILKAQGGDIQEQIDALKEFKEAEYVEKWAYELATLYHQAGMTAECIEECDDLMLWFSDGKYVYRAMELKMLYKPLTPIQQIKYDARPEALEKKKALEEVSVVEEKTEEEAPAVEEVAEEEAPAVEEVAEEEVPAVEEVAEEEAPAVEEVAEEEAPAVEEVAEEVLSSDEKAQEELADAIVSLLADEIVEEVPAETTAEDITDIEAEEEKSKILDEKTRRIPDDVVRLMSEIENDMTEDVASAAVEEKTEEAELEEEDFEEADFEEVDFEEADFEEAALAVLETPAESVEDELRALESEVVEESDPKVDTFSELEIDFDVPSVLSEEDKKENEPVAEAVEVVSEEATTEKATTEEVVIEEAELEEVDFEEADFEEADFEEAELEESELEESEAEEKTEASETVEMNEEDFDEEELSLEDEMESIDRALEALGADENTEAEMRRRKKSTTGKVPFDTGFVVTGRYDLSATSEIGLKAGLNEEQKKLFSYFVPVRGMSEQIVEVLDNDKIVRREGTSKTGNLVVIGGKGSGKTALAIDIVKAIQKQRNLQQGKMALIDGESLSKKDMSVIFSKLHGGALIIENASTLSRKAVIDMNLLMERKTGELLIVLEDQKEPMKRLFVSNPDFRKKFTSKLELPVFVNDELVTFGQTYAKENGCKLDEMGILALYSKIDILQREDHAVTVAEVKEIMDEAIEHSKRANVKHLARRVLGKRKDDKNRMILSEEDFQI